jgi:hypothetical protein
MYPHENTGLPWDGNDAIPVHVDENTDVQFSEFGVWISFLFCRTSEPAGRAVCLYLSV